MCGHIAAPLCTDGGVQELLEEEVPENVKWRWKAQTETPKRGWEEEQAEIYRRRPQTKAGGMTELVHLEITSWAPLWEVVRILEGSLGHNFEGKEPSTGRQHCWDHWQDHWEIT